MTREFGTRTTKRFNPYFTWLADRWEMTVLQQYTHNDIE